MTFFFNPSKKNTQKLLLSSLLALSITVGAFWTHLSADATQLPPGVLNYIHQKDPKAQVRFDGVVIFSNGNTYFPVIPQDTAVNPDPMGVVNTIPEKTDYPELVQFDNNFFLIKILQTSSGRLTLPKFANPPVQLKEGLLPQDLVMPNHLFIPDELKIILGELHYSPTLESASTKVSAAQTLKTADVPKGTVQQKLPEQNQRMLYAYDMDRQVLASVDVFRQKEQGNVSLGCMPASMVASADGKYLYAGCLSSNEVVAVDLSANLVKTRVPVGNKPLDLLLLPRSGFLVVGNRYDQVISLINTQELLPASSDFQIQLPGKPGAMVSINEHEILVADAFSNKIYQLDLAKRELTRTLTSLPEISAMWLNTSNQNQPELWVTSRSENKVQAINLTSGETVATLDVSHKPIAIGSVMVEADQTPKLEMPKTDSVKTEPAKPSDNKQIAQVTKDVVATKKAVSAAHALPPLNSAKPQLNTKQPEAVTLSAIETPASVSVNTPVNTSTAVSPGLKVFVLSSAQERLDVIDPEKHQVVSSIQLPEGVFPTGMSIIQADHRAYIGGAGKDGIVVVDLNRNQVESNGVALPFRTFALTAPLYNNTDNLAILDKNGADSSAISIDKPSIPQSDSPTLLYQQGPSSETINAQNATVPQKTIFKHKFSGSSAIQNAQNPNPSSQSRVNSTYIPQTSSAVMPSHLSIPSMNDQSGIHFNTPNQAQIPTIKPVGQWLSKKKKTNDSLQMMELAPEASKQ